MVQLCIFIIFVVTLYVRVHILSINCLLISMHTGRILPLYCHQKALRNSYTIRRIYMFQNTSETYSL